MSCALEIKLLVDGGQFNLRKVCANTDTANATTSEIIDTIAASKDFCLVDQMDTAVWFPVSKFVGLMANMYGIG